MSGTGCLMTVFLNQNIRSLCKKGEQVYKLFSNIKKVPQLCSAPQKLELKTNFWGVLLCLNIAMNLKSKLC